MRSHGSDEVSWDRMGSDEVARGQTRLNGVKCGQGISSVAVYMYKLMVTDDEENMSMYRGRHTRLIIKMFIRIGHVGSTQ